MAACEECWADAQRDVMLLGGSVALHYLRRVESQQDHERSATQASAPKTRLPCGSCSRGQHAYCEAPNEFWGDCKCDYGD